MKKLYLYIFMSFVLLSVGCHPYDYKIEDLSSRIIKYDDLPNPIIDFLSNSKNYKRQNELVFFGANSYYRIEDKKTFLGPWVAFASLEDLKNNIIYRMEYSTPSPYMIFNQKLYVPMEYSIMIDLDNLKTKEFHCYELKG